MIFKDFIYKLRMFGLEYFKRYYGLYRGIVFDNEDPDNLGRVQLYVPQIYGDKAYKYWAWPRGQYAGKDKGSFFVPDKDDPVWVTFENGDAKFPVWEHGHWSEKQVPETATPVNKVLKTTSGHMIEWDDENKIFRITDATGNVYEMNETGFSWVVKNTKISLGSLDGSNEPAALGDTLKSKLESFMDIVDATLDAILVLTVPTAMGPSGKPINAADFSTAKSDLASLKSELKEILSEIVTLD